MSRFESLWYIAFGPDRLRIRTSSYRNAAGKKRRVHEVTSRNEGWHVTIYSDQWKFSSPKSRAHLRNTIQWALDGGTGSADTNCLPKDRRAPQPYGSKKQ